MKTQGTLRIAFGLLVLYVASSATISSPVLWIGALLLLWGGYRSAVGPTLSRWLSISVQSREHLT